MIRKNKLASELYDVFLSYKNLFEKYKLEEKKSNKKVDLGVILQRYIRNELIKEDISFVIKDTREQSIKILENNLLDLESINKIEYILDGTTEMIKPLYDIENTILFFYDKVPLKICKNVIDEKFDNEYNEYWNMFIKIKNIQDKLEIYRKKIFNT